MHGNLRRSSLSTLIRRLHARRASGILHLSSEDVSKRIYFKNGLIDFAGSDAAEERFGEVLVRAGKLSRDELDRVLEAMKRTRRSIGQTVVGLGLLSREEVEAAAIARMKAIIQSLFTWEEGEYHFVSLANPVEEELAMALSPSEVMLESIRSSPERSTIRRVLGDLHGKLRWVGDAGMPLESTLSVQESTLLDLLRGADAGLTAAELLELSPLDREATLASLYVLVSVGVLALGEEPALDEEATLEVGTSGGKKPPGSPSHPPRLGRYEIRDVLGHGTMGTVLLADDPAIERVVAIKLIQAALLLTAAQREKYREHFYREASAAGQLVHPGIVTVFDMGHTEEQTPFIVMEYVRGKTLHEVLEGSELSVTQAVAIARDVLDALSFAHSKGIVHHDIKLSNILVTPGGRAKITDFGIALVVGSEARASDDLLGSPYYMAPEQLSKGVIDQRTDLFSFGVVLYRMLAGRLPFSGDSFAAVANAILSEEPVSPERINPAVPVGLGRVVSACLAKNPADRYASAEEAARALSSSESPETVRVRAVARSSRRRRTVWISFGAAVVLAGAAGLFVTIGEDRPDPPAMESSVAEPELRKLDEDDPAGPGESSDELRERRAGEKSGTSGVAGGGQGRPPGSSEADLFYEAGIALAQGELERSQEMLEELLRRNPSFSDASPLLVEVKDRLWRRSLPISMEARHNHRIGGCEGQLMLGAGRIRYVSSEHEWEWAHEEIRVMERADPTTLQIETSETELLRLGTAKHYKFELSEPLADADWTAYQRVAR